MNPYHNLLSTSFPIDTLPDYKNWSCEQWIDFHKRLKDRYGKSNANLVWQEYWNNKPHGWLGDKCISQGSFTGYFDNQGIQFDKSFFSIVKSVGKTVKTGLIIIGVVGGALLLGFIGYQVYTAITMRNIAMKGFRKAADNPEKIAEGAAAGLKGGI